MSLKPLHSLLPLSLSPSPPIPPDIRRSALDTLGTYTQTSALLFLLLLSTYQHLLPTSTRSKSQAKSWLSRPAPLIREPYSAVITIALWGTYLFALALWTANSFTAAASLSSPLTSPHLTPNLKEDYLFWTRAPAHIAASLLPLHLALSSSFPLSPLTWMIKRGRGDIIPYHRTHGYFLLTLLGLHGGMYLNYYIQMGFLSKRVRDSDVQLGLMMAGLLVGLAWGSRSVVRRKSRGWFLWVHLGVTAAVLGGLWGHVLWARAYVVEAGVVFGLGMGGRGWRSFVAGKRRKGGKKG